MLPILPAGVRVYPAVGLFQPSQQVAAQGQGLSTDLTPER